MCIVCVFAGLQVFRMIYKISYNYEGINNTGIVPLEC